MNEDKMNFNDIVGTDKNSYTEQDKDWGAGYENPYADFGLDDISGADKNVYTEQDKDWGAGYENPYADFNLDDYSVGNTAEPPAQQPPAIDLSQEQQAPDISQTPDISTQLENAAQEGNKEEVENIVESNPIESQEVLNNNKGNELNTEAEQITDGNEKNVEVRNDAVEDFIEDEQAKPGSSFLNNWDRIKVYQPGEEGYGAVDSYDKNAPDYVPSEEKPDLGIQERDEDFLGPDEYIDENGNIQVDPNWKPENADEDFLGPDEVEYNGEIHQIDTSSADELAASSDLTDATLPSEEPHVEDIPDEAFKDMEELGVENLDEVEGAKVETKEQAKAKQRLLNLKKSISQPTVSSSPLPSMPTKEERLSQAGFNAGALSTPSSISGGVHSSSMSGGASHKDSGTTPTSVKTGGGTAPVVSEDSGTVSVKPSTAHFSNGSMSSGSFGLMSKNRPGDIKVEKMELAGGETYSDQSTNIINQMMENSDLKDILNTDNEIEKFKKALLDELSKYKKERSRKWNG